MYIKLLIFVKVPIVIRSFLCSENNNIITIYFILNIFKKVAPCISKWPAVGLYTFSIASRWAPFKSAPLLLDFLSSF